MKRYINLNFQSSTNSNDNYDTMRVDILDKADCSLSLAVFAAFQINANHGDTLSLTTLDGTYRLDMVIES